MQVMFSKMYFYSCFCFSLRKNSFSRLSLLVPAAVEQIQNVTVEEGRNVTKECNVTAGTPPRNAFWENLKTGQVTEEKLLNIINIRRNQSGEYRCTANNTCGNESTTMFIDVQSYSWPLSIKVCIDKGLVMFNFSPLHVSKHIVIIMLLVLFIHGSIVLKVKWPFYCKFLIDCRQTYLLKVPPRCKYVSDKHITTRHNYVHMVSVFLWNELLSASWNIKDSIFFKDKGVTSLKCVKK